MTTSDRLRHEIQCGRTGDKVPFIDPAAAPLGTDDEAGGFPPTREQIETAWRAEVRGNALRAPAVTNERPRTISGDLLESQYGLPLTIAGIGVVAIIIAAFALTP